MKKSFSSPSNRPVKVPRSNRVIRNSSTADFLLTSPLATPPVPLHPFIFLPSANGNFPTNSKSCSEEYRCFWILHDPTSQLKHLHRSNISLVVHPYDRQIIDERCRSEKLLKSKNRNKDKANAGGKTTEGEDGRARGSWKGTKTKGQGLLGTPRASDKFSIGQILKALLPSSFPAREWTSLKIDAVSRNPPPVPLFFLVFRE